MSDDGYKHQGLDASDEYRRDELIRVIEHSVEKLTLRELEALYYDMSTRNFIHDECV